MCFANVHVLVGHKNLMPLQLVATIALGSWPNKRVARVRAKRKVRESHHMLSRVQRVWGNEPSHSQVNSHVRSWSPKRTPQSSKHDFKRENPWPSRVLYIIGKILKHRCLKWARIAHLHIWNTNYDKIKAGNQTDILTPDH